NTVAGAMEIQELFDNQEWAVNTGDPIGYARYLGDNPLPGVPAKPILFSFARGDQTVPNPGASVVVRAADAKDQTSFFRADLARASNGSFPQNPHNFSTLITSPSLPVKTAAIQAQTMFATFIESDGATLMDPDGAEPLFEVPIAGELPETTSFLP